MNAGDKPNKSDISQQFQHQHQQRSQEAIGGLDFVVCQGLRYALPYETTNPKPTYLKSHYDRQPLVEVLGHMYRRQRGQQPLEDSVAYWKQEVQAGRVEWRPPKRARDDPAWIWQTADVDTVAPSQGAIRIRQHVHEKVVPHIAVGDIILYETPHILAISKPAGIATVDETGGQGINALANILTNHLNQTSDKSVNLKLTPAHRLDKPVSGVLLWGKSPSQAAKLLRAMQTDVNAQKTYVARCRQRQRQEVMPSDEKPTTISNDSPDNTQLESFSTTPFIVEVDLEWDSMQRKSVPCSASKSVQRKASRQANQQGQQKRRDAKRAKQESLHHAIDPLHPSYNNSPSFKTSIHTTRFWRLGPPLPDGTILVACQPLTGFRHQIRAHLDHINWPIANDDVYTDHTVHCDEIPQQYAYVDDDDGTLRRALAAVQRDWCPKCQWTMRVLDNANRQSSDNNYEKGNEKYKPIALEGAIWLHSYHYVLPSMNVDVVAPLPQWAHEAHPFLRKNSNHLP